MNRSIFENNLRLIKESRIKQSKEINNEEQQQYINWLKVNGLYHWLK